MYICNMALADILICVVAAPVTPLTAFTGSWHFGAALCRLVPFIQVRTPTLDLEPSLGTMELREG